MLFVSVIIHLGTNWSLLWAIFALKNDTRDAMIQESFNVDGQLAVTLIGDIAAFMSMWLGDMLLVSIHNSSGSLILRIQKLWRCYILWTQKRAMLVVFTALMLGELGRKSINQYFPHQRLMHSSNCHPPNVASVTQ